MCEVTQAWQEFVQKESAKGATRINGETICQCGKDLLANRHYCDLAAPLATAPKAMTDHQELEVYDAGDNCPAHGGPFKKVYTFGSSMSAETEVTVFKTCRCAVAVKHDPVGTYPSTATYHTSYDSASGTGRLRAMIAKAKYRD